MKRIIFVLTVVLVVAAFLFAACAQPAPTDDLSKYRFVIGTSEPGSYGYAYASMAAKIINKYTPMSAVTGVYANTDAVVEAARTGAVDIIDGSSLSAWTLFTGQLEAVPAPFLRLMQAGTDMGVAQLVANDSDMHEPGDLKGHRVAREETPSMMLWVNADIYNRGLTWDDLTPVPFVGRHEGGHILMEGLVDAVQFSIGSGSVTEIDATIPGGARFLSLENSPEAIERMRADFPGWYLRLYKAGEWEAVRTDVWAQAVQNYLIMVESVPEEIAYLATKAMIEHYDEMAPGHPDLVNWTPDTFIPPAMVLPFHTGSIRAYQEAGLWSDEAQAKSDALLP